VVPSCLCLQDVLSVGESITAMLLRCEQQGKRINLSTAHLEVAAGDMLRNRQAVYATAAQQAQLVKAQMQQVGRLQVSVSWGKRLSAVPFAAA
jgi:ribosomal protein S1